MKKITFSPDRITQWMNVIRSHRHDSSKQYRILENFWESQINSKVWMLENIQNTNIKFFSSVYIFGGWYGLLAQMISDIYPDVRIFSIDQDPECAIIGAALANYDPKITFLTEKMEEFSNYEKFPLIINSSVEHLEESVFDKWLGNIPNTTPIVLQGNDFFDCPEHVRCVKTLSEFESITKITAIHMTGILDCKQFSRFMLIGAK